METNYTALGEYTASKREAEDALGRRFAILNNLGVTLARQAERPEQPVDAPAGHAALEEAARMEAIAAQAIERANAAAPRCNEPAISASGLMRRK